MIGMRSSRNQQQGEHRMADNTVRGRFVWHELMTPNAAGAHEFYSKAVGWKTQAWDQDKSYQMFAAPSGPLGASVEAREGTPQWVPYIGTDDVDATAEAATRLGAKVTTPPTSLPNAGRYAVLTDPHGATFGVHASGGESQPETPPQYGEFRWHELATTASPDETFRFYSELFGWEELGRHDMGPSGIYLLFGRNGQQTGGMFNKGDVGKPGPAYWVGYVRVKDVDGTVEKVKAARGSLLNGPMDVPGGDRIAQFADPHGAFFAVHMSAADVKAAPTAKKAADVKAASPAKKAAVAKSPARSAEVAPAKAAQKPGKAKVAKKKAAPKKAKTKKKAGKKKAAKKKAAKKKAAKRKGRAVKKAAKAGKKKRKARR
jgi:predicted enzyme related to lactoylglutathione lyase